jgi:hypothetical protein
VLYLRALVRARRHGVMPGLRRPDLFIVLFARCGFNRS